MSNATLNDGNPFGEPTDTARTFIPAGVTRADRLGAAPRDATVQPVSDQLTAPARASFNADDVANRIRETMPWLDDRRIQQIVKKASRTHAAHETETARKARIEGFKNAATAFGAHVVGGWKAGVEARIQLRDASQDALEQYRDKVWSSLTNAGAVAATAPSGMVLTMPGIERHPGTLMVKAQDGQAPTALKTGNLFGRFLAARSAWVATKGENKKAYNQTVDGAKTRRNATVDNYSSIYDNAEERVAVDPVVASISQNPLMSDDELARLDTEQRLEHFSRVELMSVAIKGEVAFQKRNALANIDKAEDLYRKEVGKTEYEWDGERYTGAAKVRSDANRDAWNGFRNTVKAEWHDSSTLATAKVNIGLKKTGGVIANAWRTARYPVVGVSKAVWTGLFGAKRNDPTAGASPQGPAPL